MIQGQQLLIWIIAIMPQREHPRNGARDGGNQGENVFSKTPTSAQWLVTGPARSKPTWLPVGEMKPEVVGRGQGSQRACAWRMVTLFIKMRTENVPRPDIAGVRNQSVSGIQLDLKPSLEHMPHGLPEGSLLQPFLVCTIRELGGKSHILEWEPKSVLVIES